MKSYKSLNAFWAATKDTRWGQAYGLVIIAFVLGLFAALKIEDATVGHRVMIFGLLGGSFGALLILVMLVPSIWLERIRKKKERGESVLGQRVLLVLYFFPFLTFLSLAALALIMSQFPP